MVKGAAMTGLLDQTTLDAHLESLAGWTYADGRLQKTYTRSGFRGATVFACYIAEVAESLQHHPDVSIAGYNQVTVTSTSHDVGGVTERDVSLARRIDEVVRQQ